MEDKKKVYEELRRKESNFHRSLLIEAGLAIGEIALLIFFIYNVCVFVGGKNPDDKLLLISTGLLMIWMIITHNANEHMNNAATAFYQAISDYCLNGETVDLHDTKLIDRLIQIYADEFIDYM